MPSKSQASHSKISDARMPTSKKKSERNHITLDDGRDAAGARQPEVSQSSSDDGMMAAIAKKMKSSMEKKKTEKEAKFLQASKATLDKMISERATEFVEGANELDNLFSEFKIAYASVEDNIRKLWVSLLKEQKKVQVLLEQKRQRTLEGEKTREEEHIRALSHARKACEDFQRIIDSLDNRNDET